VAVYETEAGTVIAMVDPVEAIGQFGDDDLRAIAAEVKTRLTRVLESMDAA